jgi:hypothetical protein
MVWAAVGRALCGHGGVETPVSLPHVICSFILLFEAIDRKRI